MKNDDEFPIEWELTEEEYLNFLEILNRPAPSSPRLEEARQRTKELFRIEDLLDEELYEDEARKSAIKEKAPNHDSSGSEGCTGSEGME